jgi:predicted transcriptional regulator
MPRQSDAKPESPRRQGGRPKAFQGETVKVALFLPPDLAGDLKAFAARHRQTPSRVVADWIQNAEVREAIARGREAFEAGDVLSHDEAIHRLSRW